MRRRTKIPYLILFLVLALIALYLICIFKAKAYISSVIEKNIERQVEIGFVAAEFPLRLLITDLCIYKKAPDGESQGFLSAHRIAITPSLIPLFAKRLVLKELRVDSLTTEITRNKDGSFNFSDILYAKKQDIEKQGESRLKKRGSGFIIISSVKLIDGHIKYIDKQISEDGVCLLADNIFFYITKLSFPVISMKTNINASADISACGESSPRGESALGESAKGKIKLNGWADFYSKDMELDLQIEGVDIKNIKPYLKNIITATIKSGTAYLTSDIIAKNNRLIAECNLKIQDIEFEAPEDIKLLGIIPISAVAGLIRNERKELSLEFIVETPLDKFDPKITKISGNLISMGLKSEISKGIEKALETVDDGEERIEEKIEKIGEKLKDFLQVD